MSWIYWFDVIGVIVFATSGVLTAIDNDFDVVGASVIGFVTALGGGTLRDMMMGQTPVFWMKDTSYIYLILAALCISYLFKKHIMTFKKSMFLFDTIGIGFYTILGVQKSIVVGLPFPVVLMMGVVSASFGGVIRDVLTNEIPLIFRREIYASACLAGGAVFLLLESISAWHNSNMLLSIFIVIIIRYLSVKNNWSLKFRAR